VNSGDGTLTLSGLPAEYLPGETYLLAISVSDAGQARWGFEMTVIDTSQLRGGVLAPTNTDSVQVSVGSGSNRDYIKHKQPGTQAGESSGSWEIFWTAPAEGTGPVHFYLAGNAANNNGNNQGDYIYLYDVQVPETELSSVLHETRGPEGVRLAVYPNPMASKSSVHFSLPFESEVQLKVVDPLGRLVRELEGGRVMNGSRVVEWDGRDQDGTPVSSGVYYYVLSTAKGRLTEKVVVLR
jgi:hypothetical protein